MRGGVSDGEKGGRFKKGGEALGEAIVKAHIMILFFPSGVLHRLLAVITARSPAKLSILWICRTWRAPGQPLIASTAIISTSSST